MIGAATFQYSQFQVISTVFTNSILPNLSLKATDYLNSYNVNYRPFIADLLSLRNNTLGYIERDWLSALDIDLGGQINFYKGWIKEKGSLNAITSYGRGSTPQLNTVIDINEEYAMKVGVYGSDSRTGYGDVSLPPAINTQNPLVISFVTSPNAADANSIQVTPSSLYEKSSNWTNDFAQAYGNLQLEESNFVSSGPVIPQQLITAAYATIPGFIKTDEAALFFKTPTEIMSAPQKSVLKIAENGGSFWLENNPLAQGPNQWDVITFSPVSTAIGSISQLNANTICLLLTTDIGAVANSPIVIDYIDTASNITISGAFFVNDYFIAPYRTANTIGYSNLTITTKSNQFGNIYVNYPDPIRTSDIFVYRSLRGNSIGENKIISNDSTYYVEHDAVGEAGYVLAPPYDVEVTYSDVPNSVPTQSLSYDNPNEVLWCGLPSANYNSNLAVSAGEVEMRVVGTTLSPTGTLLPSINTQVYVVQAKNPNSLNLGRLVTSANNFAVASADTTGPGQIYVAKNIAGQPPFTTQILSDHSYAYTVTALAMSDDANWLYAGIQPSGLTGYIDVYALQNNANVSAPWWPIYPQVSTIFSPYPVITLGEVVPEAAAITISITNNTTYSKRILIPNLEYSVAGNVINVLVNGTNVGSVGYTTVITGIASYYSYQAPILPANYGLDGFTLATGFVSSLACDSVGTTIAVGSDRYGSGAVVIFNRIIENQYQVNSVNSVNTVNTFKTITKVLVNGVQVTPIVTLYPNYANINFGMFIPSASSIKIEGFCFATNQIIYAPNKNDAKFGNSVAIQNNQLVVGSINTSTITQNEKGAAYLYALDTSISSTKIIPISSLTLNSTPFMINGWVINRSGATLLDLVNDINAAAGYTGISAVIQGADLVLNVNPNLQSTGIGVLGT